MPMSCLPCRPNLEHAPSLMDYRSSLVDWRLPQSSPVYGYHDAGAACRRNAARKRDKEAAQRSNSEVAKLKDEVDTLKATITSLEAEISHERSLRVSAEARWRLTDALLRHVRGARLKPGDDLVLEGEGITVSRRRR